MPSYYIYLRLNALFSQHIGKFWENLKKAVRERKITDLLSLQYPPHVTVACSFDMEERYLEDLIRDLKEMMSHPFHSRNGTQRLLLSPSIHAVYLEWPELSYRISCLKQKYPNINWITNDYHITLAHGGNYESMKLISKEIGVVPDLGINFDLVVWKHSSKPGAYSWETKEWSEVISFPVIRF